jgi:hypothetical protein
MSPVPFLWELICTELLCTELICTELIRTELIHTELICIENEKLQIDSSVFLDRLFT